jgi:hypothetical protein
VFSGGGRVEAGPLTLCRGGESEVIAELVEEELRLCEREDIEEEDHCFWMVGMMTMP